MHKADPDSRTDDDKPLPLCRGFLFDRKKAVVLSSVGQDGIPQVDLTHQGIPGDGQPTGEPSRDWERYLPGVGRHRGRERTMVW